MKKQFIAGAVCPACKEQDKIIVFHNEKNNMVKECVRCGFTEELDETKMEPIPQDIPTRVSSVNRIQDTPTERITIIDAGKK